jgi:hypothetical protein
MSQRVDNEIQLLSVIQNLSMLNIAEIFSGKQCPEYTPCNTVIYTFDMFPQAANISPFYQRTMVALNEGQGSSCEEPCC